jgi:DHA1 family inner membrane transport protein
VTTSITEHTTLPRAEADQPAKLLAAMLLAFAGVLSQGVAPFIVSALTEYARLTAKQAGLVMGAEMAGSAIGVLCVLFVLARLSRPRLAVIALLAVIAGNLLCVAASSPLQYCASRLVAGFGCGLTTSAFGIIATTNRPARNFAIFSGCSVVLMSLAQTWIPALLSRVGLPALFYVIATPAGVALCFAALLPGQPTGLSRITLAIPAGIKRHRAMFALFTNVLFFTSLAAFWTFVVEIAVANGNEPGRVSSIIAGSFLFGGIAGSTVAALASARLRAPVVISVNTAIMAGAAATIVWVAAFPFFVAAVIVFLLFWFTTYPFLMALLADVDPRGGLTVLGVLAQSVGWLSGPALGSVLISPGNYGRLGMLCAGGFLLATTCSLASLKYRSRA